MSNAVILHGKPSKERFYDAAFPSTSNYYWLPWMQKQLVMRDIPTSTPEVPNNWVADYDVWRKEFERYDVAPETILVGHSCGAGFLLRWLSEHPEVMIAKLVVAAPWIDPQRQETDGFFDFELDPELEARVGVLQVIYGSDDEPSVLETVDILRATLPHAKFVELADYGHFYDDRRMEFPELLEEILA